jgi:hypothetical protein
MTRFQLPVCDWLTVTHLANQYETESGLGEHTHNVEQEISR